MKKKQRLLRFCNVFRCMYNNLEKSKQKKTINNLYTFFNLKKERSRTELLLPIS